MSNPRSKPPIDPLFDMIGGGNPRHEVAACPTGMSDAAREIAARETADPAVSPSPGEGVTDEQVEEAGLDSSF